VPFDGRNRSKDALLDRADTARRNAVLDAMASHGTAYVPTHVASSGQDWLLLSGNYRQDERVKYVPLPQRLLWRGYAAVTLAGTDDADRAPLERTYRASHELTKRAAMRGVAVMAGSDAIDAYIAHGFGLHDELNELVLAGLSPAEALRAATWTPARHFGLERDLGTIETGKLADLLLLANNPLEDIANAHNIDTVISNGKLYRRKDLDAMLAFTASQASSYSVASKFLWAMLKP
jgi:imidazolonepropionase-like amidohydrolase